MSQFIYPSTSREYTLPDANGTLATQEYVSTHGFNPDANETITGNWLFQGDFTVDDGDNAVGFSVDKTNEITSVGDVGGRNHGTLFQVSDNDKTARIYADKIEGWSLDYDSIKGWSIESNGSAVFAGGNIQLYSDGHIDIAEAIDLYPDGSAKFASTAVIIQADGGLSLPNASISADGKLTLPMAEIDVNGSLSLLDGNAGITSDGFVIGYSTTYEVQTLATNGIGDFIIQDNVSGNTTLSTEGIGDLLVQDKIGNNATLHTYGNGDFCIYDKTTTNGTLWTNGLGDFFIQDKATGNVTLSNSGLGDFNTYKNSDGSLVAGWNADGSVNFDGGNFSSDGSGNVTLNSITSPNWNINSDGSANFRPNDYLNNTYITDTSWSDNISIPIVTINSNSLRAGNNIVQSGIDLSYPGGERDWNSYDNTNILSDNGFILGRGLVSDWNNTSPSSSYYDLLYSSGNILYVGGNIAGDGKAGNNGTIAPTWGIYQDGGANFKNVSGSLDDEYGGNYSYSIGYNPNGGYSSGDTFGDWGISSESMVLHHGTVFGSDYRAYYNYNGISFAIQDYDYPDLPPSYTGLSLDQYGNIQGVDLNYGKATYSPSYNISSNAVSFNKLPSKTVDDGTVSYTYGSDYSFHVNSNGTFSLGIETIDDNPSSTAAEDGTITHNYTYNPLISSDVNGHLNLINLKSSTIGALNFTNDTTAATGGVPIGGIYNTAGVLKIRLL